LPDATVAFGDVVTPLGPCPAGWHFYIGTFSCYYASQTQAVQLTARTECQSMGGDLVSISDQAEMNIVISVT